MFIIADEDMPVVLESINRIVGALTGGLKRLDEWIDIGDGICPLKVSGYWVVDTIRIDIRIKK
ncbi:hypothetical protein ES704_01963 [subsurface metagenome]|jgi:hypothetical protein